MSKHPLKIVGFWPSDTESDEDTPWVHPRHLVDPNWHPSLRAKIAEYLRKGIVISRYWGYSYCRFPDGPRDEEMGDADLSDGVWLWPEGLHIYVERYAIRLPGEFVSHIQQNDFAMPEGLDANELDSRPRDISFWTQWCASQKPKDT